PPIFSLLLPPPPTSPLFPSRRSSDLWDGLKRALRSHAIQINSLERELTLSGTISIEPEAVPLDVKIVLFGDRETWMLLQEYDPEDRKSTRLNSSHVKISYAVFCLKKK